MSSEEVKLLDAKADEKIAEDEYPEEINYLFDDLSPKLEKLCLTINQSINIFFEKKENKFEYALLIIKAMELVEDIESLSGKEKFKVAARCAVEVLKTKTDLFTSEELKDLLVTVPSSIEVIINLTKGEKLDNSGTTMDKMQNAIYIKKRALDRVKRYVRDNKMDLAKIGQNVFLITYHLMYILSAYGSFKEEERDQIVEEVLLNFLSTFEVEGKKIPKNILDMVKHVLPGVIKQFDLVNKGKYAINHIKKWCKNWSFYCKYC